MRGFIEALRPVWLDDYDSQAFGGDVLAGVILSVLLVPQAMAYASLAGLPPVTGLLAAMVAPIVYALFGTVAAVSMGPVALASLLVADAVSGRNVDPGTAAAIVAIQSGAFLAILGAFRLGRLVNFVSEPALLGFTAAAAVLIAASQLSGMTGIDAGRSGTLQGAVAALWGAGGPDPATMALGLAALAGFLAGERVMNGVADALSLQGTPRLALVKSTQLFVIILATVAAVLWMPDVDRVPEPDGGLPTLVLPGGSLAIWIELIVPSLTVAIVVFVTGIAVAKSLSSKRRKALNSSREAFAIGATNLAVGVTGGYAVGVSLSRSALVYDVGGRSPLASAVAAVIVLPVTLFAGGLLALMPQAALAALVMSAVTSLVKVGEIRGVFAHNRIEGAVIFVTFLATIGLGVQWGLLAGAASGIAVFLWSSSLPRVTREGPDPEVGDGIYRSVERDRVESDTGDVLVIRIDRPLYFGNVGHTEDKVAALVAEHEYASCLILDMRAVTDVDATGLRMLNRLLDNIEERDLRIVFASLQWPVADALAGQKHVAKCAQFDTVGDAVMFVRSGEDE